MSRFVLAQMSDPQIGFLESEEIQMDRLHREINQINASDCQAVVVCGDMVHHISELGIEAFMREMSRLERPVFYVAGNHDACKPEQRALYEKHVGKTVFATDLPVAGYRLIVLDSNRWQPAPGSTTGELTDPAATGEMDAFFLKELAVAKAANQKIIVAWHCAVFENTLDEEECYFNLPKTRRQWVLEQLRKHAVSAVLTGHSHRAFSHYWNNILFSSAETTSVAFDKVNFGFRRIVFEDDWVCVNTIPLE